MPNSTYEVIPFIIGNKEFRTWQLRNISCGAANGYVAIPPEHPLFKVEYMDVNSEDIDVHGGLTFSRQYRPSPNDPMIFISAKDKAIPEGWWVFGFDTLHFGDNEIMWNEEAVINETLRLAKQLEEYVDEASTRI